MSRLYQKVPPLLYKDIKIIVVIWQTEILSLWQHNKL